MIEFISLGQGVPDPDHLPTVTIIKRPSGVFEVSTFYQDSQTSMVSKDYLLGMVEIDKAKEQAVALAEQLGASAVYLRV